MQPAVVLVLLRRVRGALGRVGEPAPHHVAAVLGHRTDAAQQRLGHRVLGQDVTEIAEHLHWRARQLVQQVQQSRAHVVARGAGGRGAPAGKEVEVVAFVAGQTQGAGQGGEHLRRGLRAAGLFEADVVVGGHARELGDLLAAQARRTPPGADGQTRVLGPDPVARAAQEVGECLTVDLHTVILPDGPGLNQGLPIPG